MAVTVFERLRAMSGVVPSERLELRAALRSSLWSKHRTRTRARSYAGVKSAVREIDSRFPAARVESRPKTRERIVGLRMSAWVYAFRFRVVGNRW